MSDIDRQFSYKIVVVGDARVGKTSLIKKYTQGTFNKEYIITLGAQLSKFTDEVEGNDVKLVFWDIAGQKNFLKLRHAFYKGAAAVIIVFSHEANDFGEKSFQNIRKWFEEVKKYCGTKPTVLFGNKIDLIDNNDLISNEDQPRSDVNVEKIVKELKFQGYFKTSALTGEEVTTAFKFLTNHIYEILEKE